MADDKQHEWETIQEMTAGEFGHPWEATYRMRVPGGWLYRFEGQKTDGMTFVPDRSAT